MNCPVKYCNAGVGDGHMMCFHHWYHVSLRTRDWVWDTQRVKNKLRTVETVQEHRRACVQAIKEAEEYMGSKRERNHLTNFLKLGKE